MSRVADRRHAFILIYQKSFCDLEEFKNRLEIYLNETDAKEEHKDFILKIVWGVLDNMEVIDGLINQNAKGWTIERMNKVDIAIMRLAIFEMMFMDDIPKSVSLNEAVELAKRYSGDEAPSFINGVLGGIANNKELGL